MSYYGRENIYFEKSIYKVTRVNLLSKYFLIQTYNIFKQNSEDSEGFITLILKSVSSV